MRYQQLALHAVMLACLLASLPAFLFVSLLDTMLACVLAQFMTSVLSHFDVGAQPVSQTPMPLSLQGSELKA